MRLRTTLLAILALLLVAGSASADPEPRDHRKVTAFDDVDASRWTLLGDRKVRKKKRDTITVGAYEGRFDQLLVVVDGSAMNLKKMTVFFGNGKKYKPKLKHHFKHGDRTLVIDLPGKDRIIEKIELKYDALARGARAHVRVYGRDTRAGQDPAPPPYTPPVFDAKGWDELGERTVDGKHDQDVIEVGKDDGRFTKVAFVVHDSDLVLEEVTITFGNGETMTNSQKIVFQEGSRTGAIDLAGEKRFIKKITFRYSNLPGGGKARVVVYGKPAPKDKPVKKPKVRDHRKGR